MRTRCTVAHDYLTEAPLHRSDYAIPVSEIAQRSGDKPQGALLTLAIRRRLAWKLQAWLQTLSDKDVRALNVANIRLRSCSSSADWKSKLVKADEETSLIKTCFSKLTCLPLGYNERGLQTGPYVTETRLCLPLYKASCG